MSTEKYKIEAGVEYRGRENRHYPFADMKVGDSFVFPSSEVTVLRPAASWWAKRHPGFAFKTLKLHGTDQHRIWRIALDQPDASREVTS